MRYLSLVLVLLLVLAMGCGKIIEGKKIDGAKTKDILAPGTDASKVVQMFGEPQQKEQLPSGETEYIYNYRERGRMMWHTDPKTQQRLEVFLRGMKCRDIVTCIWRKRPLPRIFPLYSRRRSKERIREADFKSLDHSLEEVR